MALHLKDESAALLYCYDRKFTSIFEWLAAIVLQIFQFLDPNNLQSK